MKTVEWRDPAATGAGAEVWLLDQTRLPAEEVVVRCAGYLASIATLFLGFLWIGFDSEKRGLQDWIAGTYVIRA